MAKTYRLNFGRRSLNALMKAALRAGLGPSNTRLLMVQGRTSGRSYETPINLVIRDWQEFLVSPYGEVSWVKNVRPAGQVRLRRGKSTVTKRLDELPPEAAVPVLRDYLRQNPITRPYFDSAVDSPDADFLSEARRHPVFLLV